MPKPIHINKFPGMDNVSSQPQVRAVPGADDGSKQAQPSVIQNMDVTRDGGLEVRDGVTAWLSLAGAHSLFSNGSEFFCAAAHTTTPERLCKISPTGVVTTLSATAGLNDPLFFVHIAGRLFISSRSWNGVYENGVVRPWGAEYSNDPADYASAISSESLTLQGVINAPKMENLCLAGGRIFGTNGTKLHYNDPPLAYEMYRRDTYHEFPDELVMVAQTNLGLYIATADNVWFTGSLDPNEFILSVVAGGVIPGTLQYLAEYKGINNVPIWLSEKGIQAGVNGGVESLTVNTTKISHTAARAASIITADRRYLSSFIAPSDASFGDTVLGEVVRNGSLIT